MTLLNKTRADIMVSSFVLLSFFAFLSYGLAFSQSEGTLGSEEVINFLADYSLFVFPAIFLVVYFKLSGFSPFLLFLGLNVLIYSIFLTILFAKKLAERHNYKPFKLTSLTAYIIPGVILCLVIYLIGSS